MNFLLAGKFSLLCALAALLLGEMVVDAQQFLTPAVPNEDKFGNRSQSVDFVWTYTGVDLSATSFSCGITKINIIFKAPSATATVQGAYNGRADVIDDTTSTPFRIGFKLRNLAFTDANSYFCSLTVTGTPPVYSNSFVFKIYEPPVFINCLADGLSNENGVSFFALREGGVLNSTCTVYGNPVPSLVCATYDIANRQQFALTSRNTNYTAFPLQNRMLIYNVQRAVTKVRCVADGGPTGRATLEQNVQVDYLPSAPIEIKLVQSTLTSIRITWKPPTQPGRSRITDYYMELRHPNGTRTYTNYTVVSSNPVLDYTFSYLNPRLTYDIIISAYNAVGRGEVSEIAKFETINKSGTSARTDSSGLSTGAIVGIVFGVLFAIVLILIIVFFVLKKQKEKARYPKSYVEEAVDYPPTENAMYAHVNKKKPLNSGADESTSGYPDIIHQAKPTPVEQRPMMGSNAPRNENPQPAGFEKSRKEYV